MDDRWALLKYSLALGLGLLPLAGWAGAAAFPELAVMALVFGVSALISGQFATAGLFVAYPVVIGIANGAWIVTVVLLPLLAQVLRRHTRLLTVVAPFAGATAGLAVMAVQMRGGPLLPAGGGYIRALIAGAFAGFVTGALFGRFVHARARGS